MPSLGSFSYNIFEQILFWTCPLEPQYRYCYCSDECDIVQKQKSLISISIFVSGFLSSTGAAPPLTREAQHGKPPTPTGPLTHTNQTHSQHTNIKQQSSSSMTQQSSSFSHMEGGIKGQDYSRPQQVEDYTSSLQPTTT